VMAPLARTPNPKQRAPLYDIDPATGVSIEAASWKHSAEAALVGFGGRADAAVHQTARLLGRLQRAIQRIGTR
jgi:hypothetical protein